MKWYYLKHKDKYIGRVLCEHISDAIPVFFDKSRVKGWYIEPYTSQPHYYIVVLNDD